MEFDQRGSKVELIMAENPNDPAARCRAVFLHWLNGNGVQPQKWWKLTELIADCYSDEFADEIRNALL